MGENIFRLVASVAAVVALGAAGLPLKGSMPRHLAVYSWGKFGSGGESSQSVTAPDPIDPPNKADVEQVVATNSDTYILMRSGKVFAVGWNNDGELGNGTESDAVYKTPVKVDFPKGVVISSLPTTMPASTGLALDSRGNIWGWGDDTDGSLCTKGKQDKPFELKEFSSVTAATGAGGHALYLSDGSLFACGRNVDGELGDGNFASSTKPVRVSGLPNGQVTSLVSSYAGSGALYSGGAYYDWGLNDMGQLGDGGTANSPTPRFVLGGISEVSQGGSDQGNGQTLAVLESGKIEGWGSDTYGQLCDGATTNEESPEVVRPPAGHLWSKVDSGGATSYAVDSIGGLWVCGANSHGQFGDGNTRPKSGPYENKAISGVRQISSTAGNVAALL